LRATSLIFMPSNLACNSPSFLPSSASSLCMLGCASGCVSLDMYVS
jgi:hypothetical protein